MAFNVRTPLLWTLAVSSALVQGFAVPRSVFQARQIASPADLLESYDYVIVGGGTAGLTVADRLTEDAETTVLVLESGAFPIAGDVLPVPPNGRAPRMTITSLPQAGLGGKTFTATVGHVLGGSSAVNAMIAMRGSADDYNRWGQLFENDEHDWSWEGLLPYFKKGMQLNPPTAELAAKFNISTDASYWGTKAPIQASFPSYQYPGLEPMLNAFYELPNVENVVDSGAGGAGVYWVPTLMDPVKIERSYAYNGHYENLNRPNYHVLASAPGRRVLLTNGTATGVEFTQGGTTHTVTASKEVLLAAGALHTPKLLQVSGIGPRGILEAAGIEVLHELPGVGQNFQDHPSIGASISLPGVLQIHPNPTDLGVDQAFTAWASELWAANRTGPRSIAWGNIAAWLPMTAISPDRFEELATALETADFASHKPADVDPTVLAGYSAQMKLLAKAMRSPDTVFSRYAINAGSGATRPILNQPFSRGSVNIDPADPFNAPVQIDYRTFSNPIERTVVAEMVRWYRRYNFETSLKALGPVEAAPGASVTSDEALEEWASAAVNPSDYHPAGTAAMMPLELGGVVDTALRVYGVKGLRVIDASIMPSLPGANTCQPTYALAEKVADIIKTGA